MFQEATLRERALDEQEERRYRQFRYIQMPQANLIEQLMACREKASECERRARLVSDGAHRKTYLELADLWRDMAQQVETLHRRLSSP